MGNKAEDLSGRVFGRWTVLSRVGRLKPPRWLCRCSCGAEKEVGGMTLKCGDSRSCGCYRRDRARVASTKHGCNPRGRPTREYRAWCAMLGRTCNPGHRSFKDYGGRGILVCSRWRESFEDFFRDMGECPPGMSLERRDNDAGYHPENCFWATPKEQMRNRRNNRTLTLDGVTLTVAGWSERVGISQNAICLRLDRLGWSVEDALTKPVRVTKKPVRPRPPGKPARRSK